MTEGGTPEKGQLDSGLSEEELVGSDVPESVPGEDVEDPDLASARGAEAPGSASDPSVTDELLPEERLVEFEPPNEASPDLQDPPTGEDQAAGESIEDRLRQEQDDPSVS